MTTIDERLAKINHNFLGKTIVEINARAVNCWTFFFEDGIQASIEVECVNAAIGLHGIAIQ